MAIGTPRFYNVVVATTFTRAEVAVINVFQCMSYKPHMQRTLQSGLCIATNPMIRPGSSAGRHTSYRVCDSRTRTSARLCSATHSCRSQGTCTIVSSPKMLLTSPRMEEKTIVTRTTQRGYVETNPYPSFAP